MRKKNKLVASDKELDSQDNKPKCTTRSRKVSPVHVQIIHKAKFCTITCIILYHLNPVEGYKNAKLGKKFTHL